MATWSIIQHRTVGSSDNGYNLQRRVVQILVTTSTVNTRVCNLSPYKLQVSVYDLCSSCPRIYCGRGHVVLFS